MHLLRASKALVDLTHNQLLCIFCSIEGNPSICAAGACEQLSQTKSKKKLPGFVIPLVASLAGLILIATISAAILFIIFMRNKKQGMLLSYATSFLSLHEMVIVDSQNDLNLGAPVNCHIRYIC